MIDITIALAFTMNGGIELVTDPGDPVLEHPIKIMVSGKCGGFVGHITRAK